MNPNLISAGSTASMDWLKAEVQVTHAEFRQDRFLTAIDRYGNDRVQFRQWWLPPGDGPLPAVVLIHGVAES